MGSEGHLGESASDAQHPTGVPVGLKNPPFHGTGVGLRWFIRVGFSPCIGFHEVPGDWRPSKSLDRFWAEAWFAGSGARLDWGRGYQRFMSHQHGGHSGCL